MGKSLYLPNQAEAIERFGPEEVVYDSFSDLGYFPYWEKGDFYIQEFRLAEGDTVHSRREKIDYIVGSGHQTRSYILDRDGFLYEAPITWYVSRQKWDLSPGYEEGNNSRFDREIGEECMACHTGAIDYAEGTLNKFKKISLGIDCEKCHGPGQEHIARMERDEIVDVGEEIDYSIVNPAKLPVRQQFDVCMQCHLQGVNVLKAGKSVLDYRPGMDLASVYHIFIEQYSNAEAFGIASHAERLIQSQCFIQSGEKLTCTTCHDPHKSIEFTDTPTFTAQCQSCHGGTVEMDCGLPENERMLQQNDCISCHMPKGGTSDIPHVTFTDHKIRVVQDADSSEEIRRFLQLVCMTDSQPAKDITGRAYLLYFERNEAKGEFLDIADQNMALDRHFERAKVAFYRGDYPKALQSVENALATDSLNTWYLFKKAEIQEAQGKAQAALALFRKVYALNPDLTEAALKAGVLVLKTATEPQKALNDARNLFTQVSQKKPQEAKAWSNLGFVELNAGNLALAEKHLKRALSLDPDYLLALENMILLLANQSRKAEAKQYFSHLLKVQPDYPKKGMIEAML